MVSFSAARHLGSLSVCLGGAEHCLQKVRKLLTFWGFLTAVCARDLSLIDKMTSWV